MKVTFIKSKTTSGAIKFDEVDSEGHVLQMSEAQIGALYVRKSSEIGKKAPNKIIVTVEVSE